MAFMKRVTRMIYGYARVSTDGQSVDAQVKQLREAGAEKIFRETASGARAGRPQFRRAPSRSLARATCCS
jgi:DNA invertase Pin-like site-specific DNA recombinase